MLRRMQLASPWAFPRPLGATCRDHKRWIKWNKKHNHPSAELKQQLLGWEKIKLRKRRQMRWMDSLTLAAQRCTSWWLQTNSLTFLLFLLSHGLNTFNFMLCNHKWAFLTCYLDDPTYLHGLSYSVTRYDLDKIFLLALQSHPALVAGSGAWTLPFNAAMSKHLYTSYTP